MRKLTPTFWLTVICYLFSTFLLIGQTKKLPTQTQKQLSDSIKIYDLKAAKAYELGKYHTALEYYQKTLAFNQKKLNPSDSIIAINYVNLGKVYLKEKAIETAEIHFQKASTIYALHSTNYEVETAQLEGFFAAIAFEHKAYELAETKYQKAISKMITLKGIDSPFLTRFYTGLGIIFAIRNDYTQALNYFNKSIRILTDLHAENHPEVALVYRYIGKVYYETGPKEKARIYFEKAVGIRKATKTTSHPDMGKNYESLGFLYERERDYERALKVYYKMLDVYQENLRPDHPSIGFAYFNIGYALGDMGKYEEALTITEKSLPLIIAGEGEKSIYTAAVFSRIGKLNYYNGDYEQGFIGIQKAIAATVGDFNGEEDLDWNPTLNHVILKRALLEALDKKVSMNKYHYRTKEPDIRYLQRAFDAGEVAVEMISRNKLDYQFDGAKQQLLKQSSGLVKNTINVGLMLADLTADPAHLERLYQVVEKTRGTLLQAAMTDTKAKLFTNIPTAIQADEKKLKDELGGYKNSLNKYFAKGELDIVFKDSIDNAIFAVTRSLDSVYRHLKTNYPEYYHLKYDLAVATTEEVMASLDAETALLEYVLSDTTLFVFAITKDGVKHHRSKIDKSFYQQLRDFRTSMNGSHLTETAQEQAISRKTYVANAYELYQQLLAPILDEIGHKKELIIIPDGLLSYIPFEALITAQPAAPYDSYDYLAYVLKDYRIRYEYSATLLLQGQKKRTVEMDLFAGFAPSYEGTNLIASRGEAADSLLSVPQSFGDFRGTDLAPLTNNQPEVKNIAKIIGGKSVYGHLATESEFKKAAPNYKILHLAMHGFANDAQPNFSHLVFSKESPLDTIEDRYLYAYELYNMNLNADLAVLSACETGAGKLQKGEGVMSLSRAFKYAGVPNVIMSLWKADDAKTKDLMLNFYEAFKNGTIDSEALRTAKLAAIAKAKDNKEAAHPFYWANFVYIGNGATIDFEATNNWIWYGGFGGVMVFLLGFFFWRQS